MEKTNSKLEIEQGRNDASIFVHCAHLYSCRVFMKMISLLQIMDNRENVPAVTKEAFCFEREHILL